MGNFPKPHEIGVEPHDQTRSSELDQSSIEARYEYLKLQALIDATTRGIIAKKDLLINIGAIPELDEPGIENYIRRIFSNALFIFRPDLLTEDSKISPHQEYLASLDLIRLLGYAGITVPSILNDWSIDRSEEETGRLLGIKSLRHIEHVLDARAKRVHSIINTQSVNNESAPAVPFRHIHKGPGNGSLMDKMRQKNDLQWEEFGIGDRLYFDLRPILEKFIAKYRRGDPKTAKFVELLSLALSRALKKRWYEAKGNIISEWTAKTEIFDLNTIFELLAHPEPWIKNFIEEKVELDPEMFRFFEICRGKLSPSQIVAQLDAKRRNEERECRRKLYVSKSLCGQILRQEEDEKLDEENRRKNQKARDRWAKLYAFTIKEEHQKGLGKFALAILFGNGVRQLEEELRAFARITSVIQERTEFERPLPNTPLKPVEFFSRIFSRHFVDAIKNAEFYALPDYRKFSRYPASPHDPPQLQTKTVLDLNGHPLIHPRNFTSGFFTGTPAIFPPRSAMLISACRSDSHEKEADFQKDIAQNLDLLAPGGIILTDGIRGSYTRIDRFDEVQAAIQSRPDKNDFRAEIILDAKAQVVSLLIQRRDENGEFLTDEEKDEFLGEKVKIQSLKSVASRPDLQIINNVRRKILELSSDDVKVFEQLHDFIRMRCRAALRGLRQSGAGKDNREKSIRKAERKLMTQIQKLLPKK